MLFIVLILQTFAVAQVGINTTNPSSASVLDVNSSSDGISYGGLLPPVVASLADRNSINPGISDIGLLVFLSDAVNNNFCLQIWNGTSWENVYCITTPAIVDIATQDFDLNQTWSYSVSPSFYNISNDTWDTVSTLQNITSFTGDFLGCRDLDNSNGGGNFIHEISFNNIDVSSYTNVQVIFTYDVYEFDNGDDVYYELFLDDIGQGTVQLINGNSDYSENGTIVLNVPSSTINVRLTVGVDQNGDDDTAGFDNFRIIGL
mgnify:CR=1 FL=1